MYALSPCLLLALIALSQSQAPEDGDLLEEPCIFPQNAIMAPTRFVRNTTDIVNAKRGFQRGFRGSKRQMRQGQKASAINTRGWKTDPTQKWADLCPQDVILIRPPRWHVYQNRICFIPSPFPTYTYPSVVCRRRTCLYTSGSQLYCRPDVATVFTIPTYCFIPNLSKFVKKKFEIKTYRYCTCCHYKCPFFTLNKR
ncbi:uncharacterized protein LOC117331058 [Pecten maximus]|uniref:uncharacterized protein LOC117331058 n=1 Tax=Pecten maximus TaxID=6579 RepID=UPI0014590657|nr:uncharacterized protein LOC117331058 [Pecten maximus]